MGEWRRERNIWGRSSRNSGLDGGFFAKAQDDKKIRRTTETGNGKREWNNFINFSVKNIFIKLKIVKPCDII